MVCGGDPVETDLLKTANPTPATKTEVLAGSVPSYWWVNHKQTYRQEMDGGYIWSPKANANGARNVSYDNLSRCQRGDGVFSYANGRISQIGLVETAAVTAPKPPEFGTAGDNWSQEGWLVRVNWQPLRQPLVPQTFFELLQPLLPERHSPISTSTGRGNQGVYLAGLSELAVPTACCSPPMWTSCSTGTGSASITAVS